ncbi:hypothetical protein [Novosphingobium malaysiense]|uniref:hypothetical protein n=1 Tax=Novosphingobium malaysiense TaxID=1348853 RepID=UPI000A415DBC|nr:hypothetical protein [Novosphingobium malaysiense]
MNIGAEIPFRRSRRERAATGSLIFDRERKEYVDEHAETAQQDMRIWDHGRFRKP